MKSLLYKLLLLVLALTLIVGCLAACDKDKDPDPDPDTETEDGDQDQGPGEFVDYVSDVKLDKNSGRLWCEATVKTYVDGDTTHFNVPSSVSSGGLLKARYLAINTPESTGQIEPWGKKASDFTKEKLSSATSIIIESDSNTWNPDSTGDRFLVWVWYKTADMTDYRCLNMEILQNGLARSSKSSDTAYAAECTQILSQAVAHKLYVFGSEKDPEFYYGAAIPITLKELKTNIETYKGKSVSFEGVVVRNYAQTAYVEEYDEETGLYFGMQVYYGYNLDYDGLEILKTGNRVRIVGSVQYYATGGTYQISDIKYNVMKPDDDGNIKLISQGHTASYEKLEAGELLSGTKTVEITKVDAETEEETVEMKSFDIGFLKMHGSVALDNLTIQSLYTTDNEDSSNNGAISITCVAEDGTVIVVRTVVLKGTDGHIITEDEFTIGSKINVRGVVDVYNGVYQIKVFSIADIAEVTE
jgi:endonuclease YncB( thermonuclease family)